jgi:hypothetical protein
MTGAARRAAGAVTGALLIAALGGCGDQTSTPPRSDAADSGGGAAFDVRTATLTDQPFCDSIDTTKVAPLLGMTPEKVRLVVNRKVGDKVEGPVEEEGLKTSDVNMCIFGSSTKQFVVTVQPSSSADKVQKTINQLRSLSGKGSSEDCTVTKAPAFGSPAVTAECHGTLGSRRFVGVATGLVGGSKFYCSLILNASAKGSDPQRPLLDTCTGVLEHLAA